MIKKRRKDIFFQAGFTLLEIIIVLSLIVIMCICAYPLFEKSRLQAKDYMITAQLLHAIQMAKTEAMLRHETVSLVKLSEGWQKGYTLRTRDKMLQQFSNPKNNGTLFWRAFPIHTETLDFSKRGTTLSENGTFWYCLNYTKPRWAIMVNQSGRPRLIYPDKFGNITIPKLIC